MDNKPEESKGIELKITVTEKEGLRVFGPIHDEILCFGLLEKAKSVIEIHNMKKAVESQRIVQPKHGIIDFVRGKH